ncbi:MAG: hypothetical protein FJY67_09070 [Calditrichaeota bacterium]|nr:hypothetical protein [Calditrichota bacterium]
MVRTVGALCLAALIALLPAVAPAAHPHKYGVEFQVGGGWHAMGDVNDFVPSPQFSNIEPDKIGIGALAGVGILYRGMDDFGWQFGYNRLFMVSKYRISAYLSPVESWAEQTVSGGEIYAQATWFMPTDFGEFSFGVGPAFYSATLDRTIDIVQDGQTHLTAGTFANAEGKGFGLAGSLGIEIPLKDMMGLGIIFGGRLATVEKLIYTDASDTERTVFVGSSNQTLAVDYSGAFMKITLRSYFKPGSGWRQPKN